MAVLRVNSLTKSFGINTVFSDVNFELKTGDKVGFIGANGSGKTTLMQCLLGFEPFDSGDVSFPEGEKLGYVEQGAALNKETLWEELLDSFSDIMAYGEKIRELESQIAVETNQEVLSRLMKEYSRATEKFERGGGYEYESMIKKIAFGLGFTEEDFSKPVGSFSGGQKTRICLAKALIRQPDFLFLDEPTNHLDISMVEWLEDFLVKYKGGLLIISHDRYFLDKVVGSIYELEAGSVAVYAGNYSDYVVKKAEKVAAQQTAYDKQQEYIAKTEEYIRRYKAGIKSKQARGRQSQLERLERIHAPVVHQTFSLEFPSCGESAERVADFENVTAGYGDNLILKSLSLLIRRGEGAALVGPNGAGKTTLLKVLLGDITAKSGRVKLGSRVKVGYFAQEHEGLLGKNRLIDELMIEYDMSEARARNYLGAMLFRGDDVYKLVEDLSGGERARLLLLKLMLSGANFLVLDEPTNHLDIPAKEAVEEAILNFPGTFLIVSHDRYFLDKVASRVIELKDGKLIDYPGNYSYYRVKKETALAQKQEQSSVPQQNKGIESTVPAKSSAAAAKKSRRSPQDIERLTAKVELEIKELEAMIKYLETKLADPENHQDAEDSRKLYEEYESYKTELDAKYETWAELQAD